MVGPIQLADQARRDIGRDVQLLGPVPRNSVHEHYGWADVFLLPSICEGSATVTYEALAAGLPVICTPNTGSVVTHGIDGFIVPPGDHHSIVKALESLLLPAKLQTMSGAAVEKASEFTLEAYGRRALAALATEGALV